MEYETAEEFLADIRKEFGGDDEEMVKNGRVEKGKVKRKNNRRVCLGVQENSKRKWI